MIPQILIIVLTGIGIGISMEQHGKPKTGKEDVISAIVGAAISQALLYWGGFYGRLIQAVTQ